MPTPFETAVNLHQRRIYSFAHYFLASPQEAEDVTQEVLIRFWRHHDRLEESGVKSWLMKVTLVLLREYEEGEIRGLFVMELDDQEMTLVSLEGRLSRVMAEALADEPGELVGMLGS